TCVLWLIVVMVLPTVWQADTSFANDQSPTADDQLLQGDGLTRIYNEQTGALNYIGFSPSARGRFAAGSQSAAFSTFGNFAGEFGISSANLVPVRTLNSFSGG